MDDFLKFIESQVKSWVREVVRDEIVAFSDAMITKHREEMYCQSKIHFVKIDEASQFTGFTKGYIYNLVYQERIPFHRINRSLRFDLKELDT